MNNYLNGIRDILGSKLSIKVSDIIRMEQGVSTEVYNINPQTDNLYLRILPEKDYAFSQVVTVHNKAAELGIKVPNVIYSEDFSNLFDGKSFMLISAIDGKNLEYSDNNNRDEVLTQAGIDVAKLNTITCNGYGWIERSKPLLNALEGVFKSLKDDLTQKLDDRLSVYMSQEMLTNSQVNKILKLVAKLEDTNNNTSTIAHTDISYAHIFHNNGSYTGIIDLDDIRGADKYLDLAEASMSFSDMDYKNFLQGHLSISKISKEELSNEFRITRLFWAIEKGYWVLRLNANSQNNYYNTIIKDLEYLS